VYEFKVWHHPKKKKKEEEKKKNLENTLPGVMVIPVLSKYNANQ
jgi:hypothetical protein